MMKAKKATSIDKVLGQKLRALRNERGTSLKTLGEAVGISPYQLCKYEMGGNRLSVGMLVRICQALEVPLQYILQDLDWMAEYIEQAQPRNTLQRQFSRNVYELVQQSPEIAYRLNRLITTYNRSKNDE